MFDWVSDVLQWLLDVLLWLPRQIYKLVLEALAALINSIPVPSFMQGLGSSLGNAFSSVSWFTDFLLIPEGVTICLAAYLLRFLIRRIPLVG